jgi:phage N-6-adenine-methyltransferase
MIIDVGSLHKKERALTTKARKMHEEGGLERVLTDLYAVRIELGAEMDRQAKLAEAGGVKWADWCKSHLPLNQVQADKYRRVYHARAYVKDHAAKGLPYSINEAVKLLPTQAEAKKLAYASGGTGQKTRDSDNWQTPSQYLEAARAVLGSIDFDPFSDEEANQRVGAREFYTREEDAFVTPWPMERNATVWMNPPYGRGLVDKAAKAFVNHFDQIEAAIVLVNNATDTAWAHDALNPICRAKVETRGRIQFEARSSDKIKSSNTRGQIFYYFGDDIRRFAEHFKEFGFCWQPCEECFDE